MTGRQTGRETRYALGFLFDATADHVMLIRKRRPAWMRGLLNGIGGKLEPGEIAGAAMEREMRDEAGVLIPAEIWTQVVRLRFPEAMVDVFAFRGRAFHEAATQTDEELAPRSVLAIRSGASELVPNLAFLVPLARHALVEEIIEPFTLIVHGPAAGRRWPGTEGGAQPCGGQKCADS
jgi:8-oxo-dGTP diphosphatase